MTRLCTRCNAGGAPTNNSGTPKSIPAIFRAPTPIFVSALGLLRRYTDEDLQKVTKLALESFIKSEKYGQL